MNKIPAQTSHPTEGRNGATPSCGPAFRTRLSGITRALSLALLMAVTAPSSAVQSCPPGNEITTPVADLIDNGDGTVTHTRTGLMWKQCSEGQVAPACSGTAQSFLWAEALGAALTADIDNYGDHADWRLPNLKELESIMETGCHSPSINATRFPLTSAATYWTSTTLLWPNSAEAYAVDFNDGTATHYTKLGNLFYVRLVRGGQPIDSYDQLLGGCSLDVDGNGTQDALTDGLLILRALFGLTGTSVTNGAIGAGAARATWPAVRSYLNGRCGSSFSP